MSKVAGTADREIVLTRVLDAPRERVREAFTDPKQGFRGHITQLAELSIVSAELSSSTLFPELLNSS